MSPAPRWLTNRRDSSRSPTSFGRPRLEVGVDRAGRGRADGHEPLLGALAAGAQDAGLEVDVADARGRSPPTRAARTRTSAPAARGRAARAARCRCGCSSSLRDLVAREHVRQPPALLGRAQVGRRVGLEDALAAQVAVERAQAGDLALQRRGARPAASRRRPRPARRRSRRGRSASTASASRPCRYAPYWSRSERYASSVLRDSPRSNSR